MPQIKGSQILVKCLQEMGCKNIYGIIGTSVIAFVDALYDVKDKIRYISCRHEQVAASMADVEGRLTQKPGVVLTHSGPGTLNTLISLANSYKDASPVILITGAVKRRLRGKDGMLEVDHLKIFSHICKGVYRVDEAAKILDVFSSAYRECMSYCKGPVLIEVPEDVWTEQAEVDFSKLKLETNPKPEIKDEDIKEIIEMIKLAEKPLILSGGGVAYSGASSNLVKLAETLNIPVITTGNGRGTIPETHPLCLGRCGFGGGNRVADSAYTKADIILCIGCGISDMTTYEFSHNTSADIVIVNFDDKWEEKGIYATKSLFADAGDFLSKMLNSISSDMKKIDWTDILLPDKKFCEGIMSAGISSNKTPLSPGRVFHILSKMIPEDAIITVGAGMHLLYPMAYVPSYLPQTFLSAVNFGAMGFGLAAGLSAKLNFPERLVISVLGDGDFMMTPQDLETAKREKINLKIIVVNDNAYRVLVMRQKLQLQGRVYGSLHTNPDFVKLSEAFGIKGVRIEKPEEIEEKLKEALSINNIPVLIEIVADPDDMAPTNVEAVLRMGQC